MRLTDIFQPIGGELARMEKELTRQLTSMQLSQDLPAPLAEYASQAVRHVFSNPGKRLRPALVLLTGRLLGAAEPLWDGCLVSLAAAVELFHSASLLHDDIIDREETRRNLPALNRLRGNYVAVLAGDILYAKCFSTLTTIRVQAPETRTVLLRLFCDVTERMCAAEMGEQRILESEKGADAGEYLRILQLKTADFMAACCEGAAILCDAPAYAREALRGFGSSFGMAFQLADDSRDGDAILHEDLDLRAKASEYAAVAEGHLMKLADNEYRKLLQALCRYVIQADEPKG